MKDPVILSTAARLIAKHEKYMQQAYKCTAGKLTIGYGRNLEDLGLSVQELIAVASSTLDLSQRLTGKMTYHLEVSLAGGINRNVAQMLLRNDINRVIGELCSTIPWIEMLHMPRKVALIDMCFNLGLTKFLKFQKLFAALRAEDYKKAAAEVRDSVYFRQVGARADTIANVIETGVLPNGI